MIGFIKRILSIQSPSKTPVIRSRFEYPLCKKCMYTLVCDGVPMMDPEDTICNGYNPKMHRLNIEDLGFQIHKPVYVRTKDETAVGYFIVEDVRFQSGAWYVICEGRGPMHYKTFIFRKTED